MKIEPQVYRCHDVDTPSFLPRFRFTWSVTKSPSTMSLWKSLSKRSMLFGTGARVTWPSQSMNKKPGHGNVEHDFSGKPVRFCFVLKPFVMTILVVEKRKCTWNRANCQENVCPVKAKSLHPACFSVGVTISQEIPVHWLQNRIQPGSKPTKKSGHLSCQFRNLECQNPPESQACQRNEMYEVMPGKNKRKNSSLRLPLFTTKYQKRGKTAFLQHLEKNSQLCRAKMRDKLAECNTNAPNLNWMLSRELACSFSLTSGREIPTISDYRDYSD